MATVITKDINSVLEQRGIRIENVEFVRSTFNPAFYQFEYLAAINLNIGDKIIITYGTTILSGFIIDIDGTNFTIDSIPYLVFLPATFIATIIPPPTAISEDIDVSVVAAFNPVVIEMQRTDFTYQLYVPGGVNYYVFNAGANAGQFVANTFIQILDFEGVPNWFPRINIVSIVGTIVRLQLNLISGLPTPTISFNIESRLNFYATLRITENRTQSVYRDLRFTPNQYGFIRAEISGALRSFLNLNYSEPISETDILINEENLSIGFYFSVLENWIGSSNSFPAGGEVKTCIGGAFQIGDPNNGYYNNYYGNTFGTDFFPDLMPQWLTQFKEPVFFPLFPFTLSFLGNEQMNIGYEDYLVRYKITQANGSSTINDSPNFVTTEFISLAKLNITEIVYTDFVAGEINKAKKMEIRFGRIESGLFLDAFAPITINVKRPLEQSCNTFYVRWLNTLGGWDYWLFEGKIYEALKVENGNNYESYFDEISSISDFENVTFKNVSPAVQVGSSTVTKNEAEGLKILATSPKVYWYNEEISKWIGVIVQPGTFNIRSTKDDYFSIELTFVKPKYFNQFA